MEKFLLFFGIASGSMVEISSINLEVDFAPRIFFHFVYKIAFLWLLNCGSIKSFIFYIFFLLLFLLLVFYSC